MDNKLGVWGLGEKYKAQKDKRHGFTVSIMWENALHTRSVGPSDVKIKVSHLSYIAIRQNAALVSSGKLIKQIVQGPMDLLFPIHMMLISLFGSSLHMLVQQNLNSDDKSQKPTPDTYWSWFQLIFFLHDKNGRDIALYVCVWTCYYSCVSKWRVITRVYQSYVLLLVCIKVTRYYSCVSGDVLLLVCIKVTRYYSCVSKWRVITRVYQSDALLLVCIRWRVITRVYQSDALLLVCIRWRVITRVYQSDASLLGCIKVTRYYSCVSKSRVITRVSLHVCAMSILILFPTGQL